MQSMKQSSDEDPPQVVALSPSIASFPMVLLLHQAVCPL